MTIHVISVGTSLTKQLFDNPHHWLGADKDPAKAELAAAIEVTKPESVLSDPAAGRLDSVHRRLEAAFGGPAAAVDAALADAIAKVAPGQWPAQVSAELDTLKRAGDVRADNDVAVLVASDTIPGLTAGMWNALALAGGDPGRVRYLNEPPTPDIRVSDLRGLTVIARLPGLHLGTEEGFRAAMGGLGALGRALTTSADESQEAGKPPEDFRFYLSGGYKATIPYLIGLAEGLRSLRAGHSVEAFVLHETTSAPVRLPLRRFRPEQLMGEVNHFNNGPQRQPPAADLFEGYVYEKTVYGWKLTAFGVGLAALFGLPVEGVPLR